MNTERKETTIRITIDSNLKNVALVGALAKLLCTDLTFSSVECDDIELSVAEAVNNAIIHAYGNEGGHEVEIKFVIKLDRLVIDVCDNGKRMTEPMSTSFVYDPNDRRGLPEGGMGLFLMNKIMDEVLYKTKDDTNVLTMIRRIDPGV